jgi:hypothetical protein
MFSPNAARQSAAGDKYEDEKTAGYYSGFHMCETSLVGFLTQWFKGSKVQGKKSP